jgi:hypothetical protein
MPEQYHHTPVKPRLIYSMSGSVDGFIADREGCPLDQGRGPMGLNV